MRSSFRHRRRSTKIDSMDALEKLLVHLHFQRQDAETERHELREKELFLRSQDELQWLKKRRSQPYKRRFNENKYIKMLRSWFDSLDADQSGEISVEELVAPMLALGYANTLKEVQQYIHKVDVDNSGQVGFQEFCELLNSKQSSDSNNPLRLICRELIDGVSNDRSLQLETAIPSFRREVLMKSLLSYGHQPDGNAVSNDRTLREKRALDVRRSQTALELQSQIDGARGDTGKLELAGILVPKKSTLVQLDKPAERVLKEAKTIRRAMAARESKFCRDGNWRKVIDYFHEDYMLDKHLKEQDVHSKSDLESNFREQTTRKGKKDQSKRASHYIVTQTYAPGEDVPHTTKVPIPGYREKRIRKVIPRAKGSATGKVPATMHKVIERQMEMLGLNKSRKPRRVGGGRWGF